MIYIVEDDTNIRELVVYTLEKTNFEAMGFENGESFFKALVNNKPELILLDVMLPGEDGISILKKLKKDSITEQIPVIMLTAKSTEFDKVLGLDSGADDYIAKPFGMMELLSRIKAVLRRTVKEETKELISVGRITIDLGEHLVSVDGNQVVLTLKEFEILELLMRKPGNVIGREVLLEKVWGYDFEGETRTLDVHIRTLRQKLGKAGENIITIRGVGYKLGVPNEK